MNLLQEWDTYQTRRQLFARGKNVLGGAALASLLGESFSNASNDLALGPHFAPKAKRVIYLHMVGGPSQMDLFDYKPGMQAFYDKDLPPSIRNGQRLTTMTSGQARFPIAPSKFNFAQRGQCGMWMNSDLLPFLGKNADDICWM
ncbi:MAG: sulfatase, partial [Verrucomicrobia bacterium 12-59-8]